MTQKVTQLQTDEPAPSVYLSSWTLGYNPKKFGDLEVVNTLDNI
ncbi:MAG TPA: hypothetical protein PJ986_12505 [Gammaproteobacteria bacterium]|nr:hypothetical protein [Gammaproteobacteria bacterium]